MWHHLNLQSTKTELFEATQTTDDPLDYIRDLTNLIRSADWSTFSPEKAICQFFLKGIKCEDSKKVCVKFLEEGGGILN